MTFTLTDGAILGGVVEGVFYGAYIVLFILYLVLRHRDGHTVDGPLTLAHILLFVLCTLFFCLDISGHYLAVVPDAMDYGTAKKASVGSNITFYAIDYLAQMILLYRCWIVWHRRWMVVAFPAFLMHVSLGIGLAWDFDFIAPHPALIAEFMLVALSTSLSVNALTTFLIVIRIFSISRKLSPGSSSDLHRSFRLVTAVLIESGLLIFVLQAIHMVLFSISIPGQPVAQGAFAFVEGPITQIYGIAPTLLNIRVIMGSASTQKISSLGFARSRGAVIRTNTTVITAGARTHSIDIEHDDDPDSTRAAVNAV